MAGQPDTIGAEYLIARVEAQRLGTMVQAAALVAAAACIGLASLMQAPINRERVELELVLHSDIYAALPPEYAWVSAAGGTFRGIAVDLLWMRAERLKQEGKYYEAHQLSEWICTLQPRFPPVWVFHAWNMSYNISVATHTPQERWQWVYNGIRLLRDRGIPNNDRSIGLYHQLAWIWFHKVGDRMDNMHHYYKRAWAARMEILLGAPPTGLDAEETINWFRPVAEAPRTFEALIEEHPGVAALADQLDGLGVDVHAGTRAQRLFHPLEEQFFHPYTEYVARRRVAALRAGTDESEPRNGQLADFFAAAPEEDLAALLAYLRAKVLREQYKMLPSFMLELTGRLGTEDPVPIDWRTPWSQSIYWAMYGTDHVAEVRNVREIDVLNTDRIMLFSLQALADQGRYLFRVSLDDPFRSYLNMMPDLDYVEAMHHKYIELGAKHADEGEDVTGRTAEMLRSGHVNYLEDAIVNFYFAGRIDEARAYMAYLAEHYKDPMGQTQEDYLQPVYEFVRSRFGDMAERRVALTMIASMLYRAYLSLASGQGDDYARAIQEASQIYRRYQEERADTPEGRLALMPFSQVQSGALIDFIADRSIPVELRSLAWNRTSEEVRRWCWDIVAEFVAAECARLSLDCNRAFPEPPGMAEFRQRHPTPRQQEDIARELERRRRQ